MSTASLLVGWDPLRDNISPVQGMRHLRSSKICRYLLSATFCLFPVGKFYLSCRSQTMEIPDVDDTVKEKKNQNFTHPLARLFNHIHLIYYQRYWVRVRNSRSHRIESQ
ncbi:hypothetical protein AFLA_010262 [Aspergillus flavus NRRL3357]|nr:hypothetical protein AFLA_010262 [Aspergillus flavus NRRL3357]